MVPWSRRAWMVLAVALTLAATQVPALAAGVSRVDRITAACAADSHSRACKKVLAPHSCARDNAFHKAPFSCHYVLSVNPCRASFGSPDCQTFLANPCVSRPRGLACTLLRGGTIDEFCQVARGIPCFGQRMGGDISQCEIVEPDGSAPATDPCRLYAAIFLDACEQAPPLCGSPYGGTQELLAFTGPPRRHHRRHHHRRHRR